MITKIHVGIVHVFAMEYYGLSVCPPHCQIAGAKYLGG